MLKILKHYNTLTWSQSAGNPISKDLKFKNFVWEDASQPVPQGTAFSSPYFEHPSQ